MKNISMTLAGLQKLKDEYEVLLGQRPDAVHHLKLAREMGDLSENGYYKASRARLSFIDGRLFRLKNIIKQAHVIHPQTTESITIGCSVTVAEGKNKRSFMIVGSYEADPAEGKLSHISPIGKALMGKRLGEEVTIHAPAGEKVYTIVEITIV